MRRAIARGRVFPQYYSTDRRYGRLSLKACALFPLMWVNADDQGRLSGDPEEIKYAACPNIDHITKADIPLLLQELDKNQLIKLYNTSKTEAIQLLDWWGVQRLQWAWPSDYSPPEGWDDHLRYKKSAKEVVTENWHSQVSEDNPSGVHQASSQVSAQVSAQVSSQVSEDNPSGEQSSKRSPHLPKEEEKRGRGRGIRRGNSPEKENTPQVSAINRSGENPSPSLTADTSEILKELTQCFKIEWGKVPAQEPHKVIPRETNAREAAQLRDLAKELSARGGVPLEYIKQAFREAVGTSKFHISYVRAVLLDWLGLPRNPQEVQDA